MQLKSRLPACDIALFPFGTLSEINYSDELSGKSEKLETLAKYSGAAGCGVLCGCITDSRGIRRKSVAAAANGRLLGIADMLNVLDGEEFKSGAGLGVYAIGGYKVGLCIDGDLFFPECVQTLAMCGCNLIAVHCESVGDGMIPVLVRAYAYLYGIPVALCCTNAAYFADVTGVMACSNQDVAVFEASPKNCYRLVTSRRRGLLANTTNDF